MYQFSLHSLYQLAKRNITQDMVLWIIENAAEKQYTMELLFIKI